MAREFTTTPLTVMPGGRCLGSIVQYAYTVPDIGPAMTLYTDSFNVGPWFVRGPFVPRKARYRGGPTTLELTLARAFTGDSMIELVQQHDDAPSVYREVVQRRGYGFHHWAIGSVDSERDVNRWRERGYEIAFEDFTPSGARIVYVDTTRDLAGMVEIIEMTAEMQAAYRRYHAAAVDWDGSRPQRYED